MDRRTFILADNKVRGRAIEAIYDAPVGYQCIIKEPTRNLDQSAKFHAICEDLERSRFPWAGKPRDAAAWKVLLVSGHAIATKCGADIVPGLEDEFVNIRESTALMSKKRAASLIEYALAFCAMNGIPLREKA